MDPQELYMNFGIELSPAGQNWKGLSPFHTEDTGSFVVYPDLSYHCFGCQAHGTYKKLYKLFFGDDGFNLTDIDVEMSQPKSLFDSKNLRSKLLNDLYFIIEDFPETAWKFKKKIYGDFEKLMILYKFLEETNDSVVEISSIILEKHERIKQKALEFSARMQ